MENYYIGTMNGYFLKSFGFKLLSENISLRNSFIEGYKLKKSDGSNCIAFLANDINSKITLDSIGKCYIAKLTGNPSDASENSDYRLYLLGDGCEMSEKFLDESCMKNNTISNLKYFIELEGKKLEKMKTRLLSITDNTTASTGVSTTASTGVSTTASTGVSTTASTGVSTTASTGVSTTASTGVSTRLSNKTNNQKSLQEQNNDKIAQYEDLLNSIRLSHKISKQLLSDKNRLIASTSSNIQTSTDKLEDLNNKINEANQEIAKNNVDFEKKNNIITTLRAMITIFFILLLVMIVYYGAIYTRDAYPETYNSIANTINNSFSNVSSFNANY